MYRDDTGAAHRDDKTAGALHRDDDTRRNQQRFPETAAVMAEFRSIFGSGIKLICVSENGNEAGSAADLAQMRACIAYARTHARADDTVTATDCTCSACKPPQSRSKGRQRAPGMEFGLTPNRKFKQKTTYRADLFSEEYWQRVVKRLKRSLYNDEEES